MFTRIDKSYLEILSDSEGPACSHGPAILFERVEDSGLTTRYYACSMCRDRKECSLFVLESDVGKKKLKVQEENAEGSEDASNQDYAATELKIISETPVDHRMYCHDCEVFAIIHEDASAAKGQAHSGHKLTKPIDDITLAYPSKLLLPLNNDKKEAQYIFTEEAAVHLTSMLENAGVSKVICIGAPRIHEEIRHTRPKMKSILLDIDKRHKLFYDSSTFFCFNMFNHHLFDGGKSISSFKSFLDTCGEPTVAIVTDPPFGGRVELIANTINWVSRTWREVNGVQDDGAELPYFWIFPYFMEPHILSSLPKTTMLDFKVNYVNHSSFSTGKKGRKQGSPVRVFTNVDAKLLSLPVEEGYWFCEECQRWVSQENRHCYTCRACTSKDGRTYVHCKKCNRCVKPSWKHCGACHRCCLPDHPCGMIGPPVCKSCRQTGHKWKQCPVQEEKPVLIKSTLKRKKINGRTRKKEKLDSTPIKTVICGVQWEITELK